MSIEEIFLRLKKSRQPATVSPVEWIIAGLGNPGTKYAGTRHNAGFTAVDHIAEKEGFEIKKIKFKSLISDCFIAGKRCIIMKPSTYMNNSGEAVGDCARFYKIPPEKILIIYDDINLDAGKLRIRRKGSDGGHNGMKSIIYHLNSNEFPRIRLGVGKKPAEFDDLADWVLSPFSQKENEALKTADEECYDAVKLIITGNTDEAMNRHNS